jgi:hypothetical protein
VYNGAGAAVGDTLTVGSLTIPSGGVFTAIPGNTIVNNKGTIDGTSFSFFNRVGTFNHNNGTVKITNPSTTQIDATNNTFYNLTVGLANSSGSDFVFINMPKLTVENDLTFGIGANGGNFNVGAFNVDVFGTLHLAGTGRCYFNCGSQTMNVNNVLLDSATMTNVRLNTQTSTFNVNSFRNMGGTVV